MSERIAVVLYRLSAHIYGIAERLRVKYPPCIDCGFEQEADGSCRVCEEAIARDREFGKAEMKLLGVPSVMPSANLDPLDEPNQPNRQEGHTMIAVLKRGFGWTAERPEDIPWRIARKLRLPLSKWLRIGQWFGPYEECRKCGIQAFDAEYTFRRVGFGKAECLPDYECDSEENLPVTGPTDNESGE